MWQPMRALLGCRSVSARGFRVTRLRYDDPIGEFTYLLFTFGCR